jgi:hypothetical protein
MVQDRYLGRDQVGVEVCGIRVVVEPDQKGSVQRHRPSGYRNEVISTRAMMEKRNAVGMRVGGEDQSVCMFQKRSHEAQVIGMPFHPLRLGHRTQLAIALASRIANDKKCTTESAVE